MARRGRKCTGLEPQQARTWRLPVLAYAWVRLHSGENSPPTGMARVIRTESPSWARSAPAIRVFFDLKNSSAIDITAVRHRKQAYR